MDAPADAGPSTKTASGLCCCTSSMTRPATSIRSGMRNFTAGIERASRPRRKRMTLWSPPLAGDVDAHDQRRRRDPRPARASTACVDALAVDELHGAGARE